MDGALPDLNLRILGTSEELLTVDRAEDVAAIVLALARQARRHLDIVSRHLDPQLYDNEDFADAVKELARSHRLARVRLFVIDPRPLVSRGHRLVELAERLSSTVSIRVPAPEHRQFNEAFLVADNVGYLHRQFSDRYEAEADFGGRRRAGALLDRLNEMWERGEPDPNFRRLHI